MAGSVTSMVCTGTSGPKRKPLSVTAASRTFARRS